MLTELRQSTTPESVAAFQDHHRLHSVLKKSASLARRGLEVRLRLLGPNRRSAAEMSNATGTAAIGKVGGAEAAKGVGAPGSSSERAAPEVLPPQRLTKVLHRETQKFLEVLRGLRRLRRHPLQRCSRAERQKNSVSRSGKESYPRRLPELTRISRRSSKSTILKVGDSRRQMRRWKRCRFTYPRVCWATRRPFLPAAWGTFCPSGHARLIRR